MMTLSEALASGRPFKHKDYMLFITPEGGGAGGYQLTNESFFNPVWQILPEEQPPMRVWRNGATYELICQRGELEREDKNAWFDYTKDLAAALAPYLKGC